MKSKLLIFLAVVACLPLVTLAGGGQSFTPLVGIPGLPSDGSFDGYVDALYALAISIAALVAVVKIVLAGAKYMMDDIVTHKSEAKEDIKNALIGLLIIIGAVIILNTINSDLTNLAITADPASLDNSLPPGVLPALDAIEEFEQTCTTGTTGCTVSTCRQLQTYRNILGVAQQRDGIECSQLCAAIPNSTYFTDSRQCGHPTNALQQLLTTAAEEAMARVCPQNSTCTVEIADENNPDNFCVDPDGDSLAVNESCMDVCENLGRIPDPATNSCLTVISSNNPRTAPGIQVIPNTAYLVNDPSFTGANGELFPPGPDHAAVITFPDNLRVNNGLVDVIINGVPRQIGCDFIQPPVCI